MLVANQQIDFRFFAFFAFFAAFAAKWILLLTFP
jgi:hypothetical protein